MVSKSFIFSAAVTVTATAAPVSVAEVPLQLLLQQVRLQLVAYEAVYTIYTIQRLAVVIIPCSRLRCLYIGLQACDVHQLFYIQSIQ